MYPNASHALEAELVRLRERDLAEQLSSVAHDLGLEPEECIRLAVALLREFHARKLAGKPE